MFYAIIIKFVLLVILNYLIVEMNDVNLAIIKNDSI
jgi:hypothetical protein